MPGTVQACSEQCGVEEERGAFWQEEARAGWGKAGQLPWEKGTVCVMCVCVHLRPCLSEL